MNAYVSDFVGGEVTSVLSQNFTSSHDVSRIESYIRNNVFDKPTLVIDASVVANNYRTLKTGLGNAFIHYAVKANPHFEILKTLVSEGSSFDAASRGEIEECLRAGARVETISFGNTVKKPSDIRFAYLAGVKLFAADAEEELDKLSEHAPGCDVYIRLIVEESQADWPLSRKFGCARDKALRLLEYARQCGLSARGFSFHVGSQTRKPEMWTATLDQIASIWNQALEAGYNLDLINIGGGFPAFYGEEITEATAYSRKVMELVRERFGHQVRVMAEPGRGLLAESGMIAAEVLLVSRKSDLDTCRWVYLDIGKFSGLAETIDEAIRYQFITDRDHENTGPCILAGPSCDSADVLYEKRPVQLPLGLKSGDKIIIRNCGAYTSTYSSVGFNGFPPLDVIAI